VPVVVVLPLAGGVDLLQAARHINALSAAAIAGVEPGRLIPDRLIPSRPIPHRPIPGDFVIVDRC
jgi:hypothetical protein